MTLQAIDPLTAPALERVAADDLVQATMRWHFDQETGSPFWLQRARSLGFDPIHDVRSAADLALFPDVAPEWQTLPAEDLIPRGCRAGEWAFMVFESGGTTGAPKRVIEMQSRRRAAGWVSYVLDQHGFPGTGEGHWLHIGPSGPHLVGRTVGVLAHLRRSLCYYIDFDPRWVKRCLREGRRDEVTRYVDHVIDQALAVLDTQPVGVIFATPAILESVCSQPRVLETFQRRARGLIWSGTSMSDETLRLLDQEFFPDARVVGLYGNTMLGIAPQRPAHSGDAEQCVFQPFHPYCLMEVVDPDEPSRHVAYGASGQVRASLLTRELFLPRTLERDLVVRVAPTAAYPWDGVARVRPLPSLRNEVVEGVY